MKPIIHELGLHLHQAAMSQTSVDQVAQKNKIDLNAAYKIQKASIDQRIKASETLMGYKLGFTSKAKMEQMGVHSIIWGRLTSKMEYNNKGTIKISDFIHPRVEPEIAFWIGKDIKTTLNKKNIHKHLIAIAPALEVIDSRFKNFKFSLEDVVADNCSSAAYAIGQWYHPSTVYNNISIQLKINKKEKQKGNAKAILGNPINSLIELTKIFAKNKMVLKKDMIVLAGAATSAEYIKKGDKIEGQFEHLGKVNLNVI